MKVSAILWDGFSKLKGVLELESHQISFHLTDFANTDLELEIIYDEVLDVKYQPIYGLDEHGLEIISKSGKSNVFVVDNAMGIKKQILDRVKR